jgi:pimeloyl-ACP methyl ester carboxylesterase
VAGLVLVDGFPPDYPGSMVLPPLPFATSDQGELLHATGLSRMTEWFRRGLGEWDAMTALSMQRGVRRATTAERELSISNAETEKLGQKLAMPLRVIASSRPLGRHKPCDYSLHWFAHNEALADLSDESMHYVVRDCDHWIPLHRPDAVVEPVRGVLAQLARSSES